MSAIDLSQPDYGGGFMIPGNDAGWSPDLSRYNGELIDPSTGLPWGVNPGRRLPTVPDSAIHTPWSTGFAGARDPGYLIRTNPQFAPYTPPSPRLGMTAGNTLTGYMDAQGNIFDEEGNPVDGDEVPGTGEDAGGAEGGGGGGTGEGVSGPGHTDYTGYWPGQRPRAPILSRPGGNQPFYQISNTDNIGLVGEQDRMGAYNWLHGMDQSLFDRGNADTDLENYYTDQMFSGPAGYDRILSGQGGYTPEEARQIAQRELYSGAMATPGELGEYSLKDWEEIQMAGDPYAVLDNAIPVTAQAQDAFNESAQHRRGAYTSDLRDPLLSLGEDAEGLQASDEFMGEFRPVTGLADQAARNNMLRATARNDELVRSTVSGTVSPLAINAARARNVIYGDVAAEDAYADAKLREDLANRDLAAKKEQMRKSGVQDFITTKAGLQQAVGNAGMGLEGDLGREYQDINRWGGEWLGNLGQAAESTSTNRATGAAAMRRENLGKALDTRYSQGLGVGDRFSSTSRDAAATRRADEGEARTTMGRLQGQSSDRVLAGNQQRMNAFTAGTTAAQGGATNIYRQRSLPSTLDRIIQAGSAAAMAAAGAGG